MANKEVNKTQFFAKQDCKYLHSLWRKEIFFCVQEKNDFNEYLVYLTENLTNKIKSSNDQNFVWIYSLSASFKLRTATT